MFGWRAAAIFSFAISRHLGLGFRVRMRVRVRVRKHFFQGTQGGLGLTTLGGKMSGEGLSLEERLEF